MAKRFKILDGALNYLKFGDTSSDVTLPAGTPLRKFQEVRRKERAVTYVRETSSLPKSFEIVSINPFAFPVNDTVEAKIPMSQRVAESSAASEAFTVAGISRGATVKGSKYRGFIPAKCTLSIPFAGNAKTDEPSKLTGVKYSTKGRASFTFPYGKKAGTILESEVRAAITAVYADNKTYDLRFKSEKI
jgi:hypothetical protein